MCQFSRSADKHSIKLSIVTLNPDLFGVFKWHVYIFFSTYLGHPRNKSGSRGYTFEFKLIFTLNKLVYRPFCTARVWTELKHKLKLDKFNVINIEDTNWTVWHNIIHS